MTGLYLPSRAAIEEWADYSIVILTPCKDYEVPARFAKSVANLIAYSWLHGLKVYQMGVTERMVVHWARNDLARQALDRINEYTGKPFSHFLWIDDDSVFNPDMACYLAQHGDLDVVSALYFGRTQHLPVVYVKDGSDDPYKHYPLIDVPTNLCEVDAVGFGACLTRRETFERLPSPWFSFHGAGEDIYFCVEARKRGIRIWCDGTYRLGHIGDPQIVTEATYHHYMAENQDRYADRIRVGLGGKKA